MIRNILIVVFVYLCSFSIDNVNPYKISFSVGSPAYADDDDECYGELYASKHHLLDRKTHIFHAQVAPAVPVVVHHKNNV